MISSLHDTSDTIPYYRTHLKSITGITLIPSRSYICISYSIALAQSNSNFLLQSSQSTMGVLDQKMYGPISNGRIRYATARNASCVYGSKMPLNRALQRRHFSHQPCLPTRKAHQRHVPSRHSQEGRPPRHPGTNITKYNEMNASNILITPTVYVCDLDMFINEKFPAELITKFDRKNSRSSQECNILTDEAFCSLVGMGDLNDDIIVIHQR
mmetsp:Transcript_984/g.1996  ORF Transcript_984/g.1996 Transcript_984/m.1996 type:complete len:212 (-) Transcript_984:78-713(-)